MSAATVTSSPCLGFLTAIDDADLGYVGGYLLLNAAGRPLEFHCTAPVKPTRTQEILYGPTLKPFLLGEQIGQTLLAKSKLRPLIICTDREDMMAARDFTDLPIVRVLTEKPNREGEAPAELARHVNHSPGDTFALANNRVACAIHFSADERLIRDAWPPQADHLDLLEPFQRIREALEEAQKSTRQAA
jgi:hypothetical protein